MLANSHHRPASRANRRGFGVLAFLLALLILLILSPRARADHSAADTVMGLAASATHTVSTATHDAPGTPSAPITAPSANPAPSAPAPVAGGRPVAVAAPSPATPSDVAGTVHTTLERTAADAHAAGGHVAAQTHVNTAPINDAAGLAGRVTSAARDAPRIVAGGASTVAHTIGHVATEAPAAGPLLREVARSTGTVSGTVEHLAPRPAPIARVTLPALPSPVLAPPHARAVLRPGGLPQLRQPIAPTAPGQTAATALQILPTAAGSVLALAQVRPEIAWSPTGASAASRALAAIFATTLQPAPYALLTADGTTALVPVAHDNAPPVPPPAHHAPAAPPGDLAAGATSGSGGGLSTSTFLALAGLLMLAMPRALRRLRLLSEPSLTAPFALISARPG